MQPLAGPFGSSKACKAAVYRWGRGGCALLVGIYIDDLVITMPRTRMWRHFKVEMKVTFYMRDLRPLSLYLGNGVYQDESGITLQQTTYGNRIIELAGLTDSNPSLTPMEERPKLIYDSAEAINTTEY